MPQRPRSLPLLVFGVAALACVTLVGQGGQKPAQRIYWGDEVPAGWTGKWPVELQTVAEQTKFTRTLTSASNLEFVTALRGKTENVHVLNMFTTALRKSAPAMVIASP